MNADNFLSVPSRWTPPPLTAEDCDFLRNAYRILGDDSESIRRRRQAEYRRWYRRHLKETNPEGYERMRAKQREYNRKYDAKRRQSAGV